MVFSSIVFLIFFLPVLLLLYYIVPKRLRETRNFILLAFSLVFYGWGGPKFLVLLLSSVAINFFCGLFAGGNHSAKVRKIASATAVVLGLGLLGWFKYAGFFAEILVSMGAHIPVPEVVLPIGISFFTFQGLSYVIDVYRGDASVQKNPLNVALYVALFPQLVAGPIVRYTTVENAIQNREENVSKFSSGVIRFLCGMGKKMILANAMGEIADAVFLKSIPELTAALAWVGAVAYTFQIYFDFSAYSDMAIGLGRMFGFEFLENFDYPYISKSITDFWRRWHISLSTWFRDYLYIPLGGSRCSKARGILNLTLVWLLTGLWHGAAWTYVFWGVWFLILLIGERYIWGGVLKKTPPVVGHIYTMLAVILSWVLFRASSAAYAAGYIGAMFGKGGAFSGEAYFYLRQYLPEFILCIIAAMPVKTAARTWLKNRKGNPFFDFLLEWFPAGFALLLLALSYLKLVTGSFNPFIYFQF